MRLDKLSPKDKPYEIDGLPTLYGGKGAWVTALPMPLTSTFQHSLVALPHPGRGNAEFAEPGEVPVILENDDGTGDVPNSNMIAAARWLIDNDAEVEQANIATIRSSLDELINIQKGIDGVTDEAFNETWEEAPLRPRVRLLHIALPDVVEKPSYFGVELACNWDTENDYGIMFHGTDVVKWRAGDVPNLPWIALRHAEGRS
ncbi:DUF6985 domain-containing protein [Agrobacterium bohemicum]|nr:hypothetical protein [Agrobacterium bohemicum]